MRLESLVNRIGFGRLVACGLFAGMLALASGCGGGVGDISGKVTYKGNPVVYGSVGFVGSDGTPRAARINPDGTYTVKDVAAGDAKVTVVSELPNRAPAGADGRGGRLDPSPSDLPKDAPRREAPGLGRGEVPEVVDPEVVKKWVPIPLDFGDVNKTKLKFSVRKGPNTFDITLD